MSEAERRSDSTPIEQSTPSGAGPSPLALVLLLVGAALGLLAAPGLTWLDAGELGAAAAEMGVAHPPGFPVFVMVTHAVMNLVPLGDLAFRGNLASALTMAAATLAVFGAARALGARRWAAAGGALLFAATPLTALHGTTIEVYAGAALFTAALIGGFARLAAGDGRWGLALGVCLGLAAGHHAELRLFALVIIPAALWQTRRHPRGRAVALGATLAGAWAAAVIVYLPLRAAAEPWRNWGDPSTLGAWWDHLTGARIRQAFAEQFGRLDLGDVERYGEQLVAGAPVLLLVGLLGCALITRRPGGWLVPAVWLIDGLYATALNPMGLEDLQNGVPGWVALGIAAAVALEGALAGGSGAHPSGRRWLVPAALIVAVVWVSPRLELYTHDRGLPRVIDRLADSQPPDGLVLTASDNFSAGLAWRQVVEGTRPDLAVVVRQHVGYASSVAPVARRRPAALDGWSPGAELGALTRLTDGWPVAWEWASGLDARARPAGLAPRFPLFVDGASDDGRFEQAVAQMTDGGAIATFGRQGRRALALWLSDLGRYRLGQRRAGDAVPVFEAALLIEPEAASRWNNLGTALAAVGRFDDAAQATEEALARAPHDYTARLNLARYQVQRGRGPAALALLDGLIEQAPTADALALRGVVRGNAGDLPGAAADFRRALTLNPRQPEAQAGLRQLERMRRRPE